MIYSDPSTTLGSTFDARLACNPHATPAISASVTIAAANVVASVGATSNSSDAISRFKRTAIADHYIGLAGTKSSDLNEGPVVLLEFEILRDRSRKLRKPERSQLRRQIHELRRLRTRQRAQQHAVENRENRSVCTNTKREREDHHRGEARRTAKRAQSLPHIAH